MDEKKNNNSTHFFGWNFRRCCFALARIYKKKSGNRKSIQPKWYLSVKFINFFYFFISMEGHDFKKFEISMTNEDPWCHRELPSGLLRISAGITPRETRSKHRNFKGTERGDGGGNGRSKYSAPTKESLYKRGREFSGWRGGGKRSSRRSLAGGLVASRSAV